MSDQINKQLKPLIVTFVELRAATEELHMNMPQHVSTLHDVWKRGTPTPESIIRNPKHYDERKQQAGNVERHIVFPTLLGKWIEEVCRERGIQVTPVEALRTALGGRL